MSTVNHEEAFAAELRAIADAEQPTLSLDAATVTHGGRRRRRRRAVRNGALATLASAAVVVGIAQLTGVSVPDTGPAGPTQEPRSFGTGQTAELAPGVVAANLPETIEVDGTTLQDLGFTSRFTRSVGERETPPMPSVLETHRTEFLTSSTGPSPEGYAAELHNVLEGELYQGMSVGWLGEESAERYSTFDTGVWSLTSSVGMPVWSHEQLVLGSVPSWLDEPRVVLYSQRGFTLADGSIEHDLEVPSFAALTDDHRLMFVVKVTEEQGEFRGNDPDFLVDAVLYFHSDGVFVGNQCGPRGAHDCAELYGGTFLAAAGLPLSGTESAGDLAVQTRELHSLHEGTLRWQVSDGRWVPQSAVGGVIISNHFLSDTPDEPEGGPNWQEFVAGIDAETGAELWRWDVGEYEYASCAPAGQDSGHDAEVVECWWDGGDHGTFRHSFHVARTGALLEEDRTARAPEHWDLRFGGFSDHAFADDVLVGPDGKGGIVAIDPETAESRWRSETADRVVGFRDGVVYGAREGQRFGQLAVVGIDASNGREVWRTELGDDVIDVVAVGGYLLAIHGEDYSAFELAFSRVG